MPERLFNEQNRLDSDAIPQELHVLSARYRIDAGCIACHQAAEASAGAGRYGAGNGGVGMDFRFLMSPERKLFSGSATTPTKDVSTTVITICWRQKRDSPAW